ncbi:hypothetical protein [Paenibacillus sp. Z3-2]
MGAAPHGVAPRFNNRGAHHSSSITVDYAVMHAIKAPRPHSRSASLCCMSPIGHAS